MGKAQLNMGKIKLYQKLLTCQKLPLNHFALRLIWSSDMQILPKVSNKLKLISRFIYFWNIPCVKSVRIWSFLVRVFPHLDWIRTRKTPNTDTFYAVICENGFLEKHRSALYSIYCVFIFYQDMIRSSDDLATLATYLPVLYIEGRLYHALPHSHKLVLNINMLREAISQE